MPGMKMNLNEFVCFGVYIIFFQIFLMLKLASFSDTNFKCHKMLNNAKSSYQTNIKKINFTLQIFEIPNFLVHEFCAFQNT